MLKKKKYDFKVYGTGYIRLVMLFFAFFCLFFGRFYKSIRYRKTKYRC